MLAGGIGGRERRRAVRDQALWLNLGLSLIFASLPWSAGKRWRAAVDRSDERGTADGRSPHRGSVPNAWARPRVPELAQQLPVTGCPNIFGEFCDRTGPHTPADEQPHICRERKSTEATAHRRLPSWGVLVAVRLGADRDRAHSACCSRIRP